MEHTERFKNTQDPSIGQRYCPKCEQWWLEWETSSFMVCHRCRVKEQRAEEVNALELQIGEWQALVGTIRGLTGCPVRNVCDLTPEQHSHEMMEPFEKLQRELKAANRLNGELWDHLMNAWGIIANAGPPGCLGNWKLMEPQWVDVAEKWRDKWHDMRKALRVPLDQVIEDLGKTEKRVGGGQNA